jgi:hypothetical protein
MKEDWWVRHSWLIRLANAVYLKLRHPALRVPDPTERLIDKIREFAEANGAKFLVGLASQRCRADPASRGESYTVRHFRRR